VREASNKKEPGLKFLDFPGVRFMAALIVRFCHEWQNALTDEIETMITALSLTELVRLAQSSAARRNVPPTNAIPGIEITPTALGSIIIKQTTPEAGQIVVTATYIQQFLEAVSEVGKRAIELRKSRPKQPDVRTIKGRMLERPACTAGSQPWIDV
jgi:hypothetical protein